jgi:hypothetical protein
MGELFGGARLPNYLEPSTKNSNVPEPKGCFTDWLAEPRPSVRHLFGKDWKVAVLDSMQSKPGIIFFVSNTVLEAAGRRLGTRLGVAHCFQREDPGLRENSICRSGASPPYGVVKLPNVF